jgi:hypothetical protein
MTVAFDTPLPEEPSLDDLVERHRALVLERQAMEKLMKHPGWAPFAHLVQENAKMVLANSVGCIESVDHALKENFMRGTAAGLERLLHIIPATKLHYDLELERLEKQIQEMQNGGRINPDDDRDSSGASERPDDEPELPFSNGRDAGSDFIAP